MNGREWTAEETARLYELVVTKRVSQKEAGEILGRSERAVAMKVSSNRKIKSAFHARSRNPRGMSVLMDHGCDVWGLTKAELTNSCKLHRFVRPRQVLMWFAVTEYGISSPIVGRALGGRDHSTVLHGVQKVNDLLLRDTFVYELWEQFEKGRPSFDEAMLPPVWVTCPVKSVAYSYRDDFTPQPPCETAQVVTLAPEIIDASPVIDEAALMRRRVAGR